MSLFRLPPYRASQRRDREIVERVLVRLGLIVLADVEVSELPLGTRRLVELARVIVAQPRLVLLDEVGSGLDAGELEHLGAAIGLIRDSGAVVVLVEHNMPFVMGISDRVHVLSRGGLLATGTPSQIQEDESVLAEYTGRRAEAAR
jgi:branched-chain amino acid transport system permease protein